ncbi:hypothetical protein ACIQVK_44110 [Streptomyces sp. NPDC090493]|uniref:hypothetical protein n=1 Tax=Streptomyces sp. NPDC090493 TaxID=3365964 RepID=UPI00380F921A
MSRLFKFWRLPAGVILWFQRYRGDGLTSRTLYTAGAPIRLSLNASTWTRDAYYGPGEKRRFGQWHRALAVRRVMSSYCSAQPKVWGGIALAFPRLHLSLTWESRSWTRNAEGHGRPEPCQACADAGWPQHTTRHET